MTMNAGRARILARRHLQSSARCIVFVLGRAEALPHLTLDDILR